MTASVLLARSRQARPLFIGVIPAGEIVPAERSLDAIRAAGL